MPSQSWKDFYISFLWILSAPLLCLFFFLFFFPPGNHTAISYKLWFTVKSDIWILALRNLISMPLDLSCLAGIQETKEMPGCWLVAEDLWLFLPVYYMCCAVNRSQGKNRGAIEAQSNWRGLPRRLEGGWVKLIPTGFSPSTLKFMLCHDSLMLML